MINYTIRKAIPFDIDEIINLCEAHAAYEQAAYQKEGKAEKLAQMLFGNHAQLYCFLVEFENKIIGYATFSKECSTWYAAYYMHMDCLFLYEAYRGNGIGEALVNEIVKFAIQEKANHIEWQTPIFNERAIKFYKRIGAKSKEKLRFTLNINQ
jgi:GNAT superfamily N-acetyltransferase